MADPDRSIVPSGARQRRAWRAGHRADARWLTASLVTGSIAVALAWVGGREPAELLRRSATIMGAPSDAVSLAVAWGWMALRVVLVVVGAAVAAKVGVAVLTGRLGPVDWTQRRRLGPIRTERPTLSLFVVSGVAVGSTLWLLTGVLAGAARAVDATGPALAGLWLGWAWRVAAVVTVVLAGAGLVQWRLARRSLLHSLYQTPAQARDDARERGARAR